VSHRLSASLLIAALLATSALPVAAAPARGHAVVPKPSPSPAMPAVPNVAAGYAAPQVSPSPPELAGITAQPFVGITLQDAIGMALLKNPDLAVSASNARIAGYQIAQAKGAYDVNFMLEPSVTHVTEAPQNAFFAGPNFGPIVQNHQQIQGGVSGITSGGEQYSVSLAGGRLDDNTTINAFNPTFPTSLQLALTQPLLQGLRDNPVKHQIELAVVGADASQAQTLAAASQTIASVENSYWDLVAAWRAVAIQEEALKEAIAQQGSTARLAKAGQAANIDAVESSGQVAMFEDNVYSALQDVASLQNTLKSLIVDDPADPIWRANLVPTSPVLTLPPAPSLDAVVASAMKQRPEIRQIADLQKQADVDARFAKDQALPKLDIQAGYQSNGFAGNVIPANLNPLGGPAPTVPSYLLGNLGQSFTNTFDSKFPTYNLGIVFSTPLGNHAAKAGIAIARERQRIAALQGSGMYQRIQTESRNAVQLYGTAVARLNAARVSRETAEQVWASENRKFHNGVSTTYLVLQRQVELQQARGRELQAQTDLNKAVVELQRVTGDILTQNGVTIDTIGATAAK
jgi:HAE1 family hydrophobic/amphiphilic exporter-1